MLRQLRVEALQGLEVVALFRVIEGLSVIEILQVPARGGAREQAHRQRAAQACRGRRHALPIRELYAAAGIRRVERDVHELRLDVLAEGEALAAIEVLAACGFPGNHD